MSSVDQRAREHAALGDPVRLAIVDELAYSDRTPGDLAARHGLATNLVAHHLAVLEDARLVERVRSAGDGRRRYVRLRPSGRRLAVRQGLASPVLFVCTRNSARSQLAAALWRQRVPDGAASAGTEPAAQVHPEAARAAQRAGFDLGGSSPRAIDDVMIDPAQVVTVCDRAHEELARGADWWHWSISDPVRTGRPASFDRVIRELVERIDSLVATEVDK